MKQIIPNRYEIHYVLDGGVTEHKYSTDTLKQAKTWCNTIDKPKEKVIIDKCRYDKQIKP